VPTPSGVGTVQFVGRAVSHDDVTEWLEALAAQQGYANPYFTESRKKDASGRDVIEFTSAVTLTPDALSRRYAEGVR
jgi:hypothetical protein